MAQDSAEQIREGEMKNIRKSLFVVPIAYFGGGLQVILSTYGYWWAWLIVPLIVGVVTGILRIGEPA